MNRTKPVLSQVNDPNHSSPHVLDEGKITPIKSLSADKIAPAGSVWSCTEDMARWMICMLDSSKFTGGRLLSPATWQMMYAPRAIVPPEQFYPTALQTNPKWTTYALGWFQHDYKGHAVNFHTGSLPGEIAIHGQLPAHKLAVYVFGNLHGSLVRHILMYTCFDIYAGLPHNDWNAKFKELEDEALRVDEAAQAKARAERVLNTKPTLDLSAYAGRYTSPLYGSVAIEKQGETLTFNVNDIYQGQLNHWHYNTFKTDTDVKWVGEQTTNFVIDEKGKVGKLIVDGLEFTRAEQAP